MTDTKVHDSSVSGSPEGRVFRPASEAELAQAVELALDYRGDVTLELTSGEFVVGYLFNRQTKGAALSIEFFPEDSPAPRVIPCSAIAAIAFTGEDTASGKSWEAWASKKESERRADAQRVEEDARARGLL
ncbi:MAG: hypothetical protein OEV17_11335 [Nitrospira sp.]|nr:hypothetical protein [Nitrospira sp.]